MICQFQNQHTLDYVAKTAFVLKEVTDKRKSVNENNASTALTIELTTFRRHETTMEVTMLKNSRRTRMTRSMGRVTQFRVCIQNGDRSAACTSQQKQ